MNAYCYSATGILTFDKMVAGIPENVSRNNGQGWNVRTTISQLFDIETFYILFFRSFINRLLVMKGVG